MSHEPYPTDRTSPQQHQPGGPAPRKAWRTALGVILIVIGVIAMLAGLSGAMSSTDDIDAGYLVGVLIAALFTGAIFFVPGILLLRRPRR